MVNLFNEESARQWSTQLRQPEAEFLRPISLNGKQYEHIEDTESFVSNSPDGPETLTARALLQAALPSLYRSKYHRVNPPPAFFEFNQSARNKLLRCAQNFHYPITPSPETDNFVNFFRVLSNQPSCWNVQTQFSAAIFAANTIPSVANGCESAENYAAAQCIQFGWTQKHPAQNTQSFMYEMDIQPSRAIITVTDRDTFQSRVTAACAEAQSTFAKVCKKRLSPKEVIAEVQRAALMTLYYRDRVWLSTTSSYGEYLRGHVIDFIDVVLGNALQTGDFDPTCDYPTVEEPEDRRHPGPIILKWIDFVFEGNPKYLAPRAANDIANTAAEVLGDFSEGDLLTTSDLLELGLSRNQITNWAKYGVLKLAHKVGRQNAYYLYSPPPRQARNILRAEPISLESMNRRLTKQLDLEDLRIRTAEAANPNAVKYNMMVMETQGSGKKIRDEYLKPGGISTVAAPAPDIKPPVPMFKPAPLKNPAVKSTIRAKKFQSKIAKKGAD